jgi:hypothetical protein
MKTNIKIPVLHSQENSDSNNSEDKEFGIYELEVSHKEFDPELGYGGYNVLEASWFSKEKERDDVISSHNTEIQNFLILEIAELVDQQGTVVQEETFKQTPVHHVTSDELIINGEIIRYIGKVECFDEAGAKYSYSELELNSFMLIYNFCFS